MSLPDPTARFDAWLAEHRGIVYKLARVYAPLPADEADLVQEMLVQLWRSLANYREQCRPSTWTYRVCLNTALTWHRGERRRQTVTAPAALPSAELRSLEPRPGWTVEQAELLERLFEAMRSLRPSERALIVLSLDGLSYREIGEVTGLSENHVGVALTRTRKKLSTMLEGVRDEL